MPESAWSDAPEYHPLQPFDRDPVKINRVLGDDESLWKPSERLSMYADVFGAGFRLENPVYAANQILSRPSFKYDPEFDWNGAADNSEAYKNNGESFLYAGSQGEWDFIEQKIAKEQSDREQLFSNGLVMGTVAAMAGGMLSPTMALPLVGPSKGVKGVAEAFALAGTAVGMDELVLQADQELRTWEETGIAIASGTVLGGLMGSAAVYMRTAEKARLQQQMEIVFGKGEAPSEVLFQSGSMGAASTTHDVGRFKRNETIRPIARKDPHGRLVTNRIYVDGAEVEPSPTARRTATIMTDTGLKYQGNVEGVASVPGGAVEHRIPQHNAPLGEALMVHQNAYAKYLYNTEDELGRIKREAANIRGNSRMLVPKGKMTAKDFGDEVSKALNTGDYHPDPHVQEAVQGYRRLSQYIERVNEFYHTEAKALHGEDARKLFEPFKTTVDEATGETTTWWHHMYDPEKIQGPDFDDWLIGRVDNNLRQMFIDEQKKFTGELADFEAQLAEQGVRGTDAFKALNTTRAKEVASLRKAVQAETNPNVRAPLEKQLLADEHNLTLLRALADSEVERGMSKRLIDELYDSIEEITGAKIVKRGGVDVNLRAGEADFSEIAREMATHLANKIRGQKLRVAGADIMQARRGPELMRMLHDKYEVKSKFLVTDPDLVARSYIRQVAPDLELHRAFGSVNAAKQFDQISYEYENAIRKIHDSEATGKGVTAKGKTTRPFKPGEREAYIAKVRKQHDNARTDLGVLIDRLRHQRGIPDDVYNPLYRLGRTIMNANVPLYMGMVLPSSVPDFSRPLFKFHLKHVVGDGLFRKIADPKLYDMAVDQLHLAGVALDPILHTRPQALWDIYNASLRGGTRLERGVEWLANKTGVVALFEQYTAAMKHATGNVAIGEISRGIRLLKFAGDAKLSKADRKMYTEMLASLGLDDNLQRRIWQQMTETPNGGTKLKDNWMPNTESWDDMNAAMAYRAALAKIAEFDTIITPGIAKPNWMDQNLAFRMVAQFKSFSDASTSKTLLATMQDMSLDAQGMAFLNAVSFSLALGAASFYMRSFAVGGDAWEKAKNASTGTIMDEAIDRSGLIGWFGEGLRIMDQSASLSGTGRFGDQGVTRRSSQGLFGVALGPSYGTAAKMLDVYQGMDSPTQSTLHRMRQLAPWNQVVWMHRMVTDLEESLSQGFPERRDRQ